jgi:hypothetical protein
VAGPARDEGLIVGRVADLIVGLIGDREAQKRLPWGSL